MNRSIVRFLIAKLLLIEAALLVVPLIVALIYQEDAKVFASILGTMGILLFLGVLGTLFKPKNYHIYTKEGMLIVALCWVLWSFFGGLPFVFAGQIPSVIDAFFEMSSGLQPRGLLFSRYWSTYPLPTFLAKLRPLDWRMGIILP
ncbi:MAG: hypothetical protein ACLT8V_06820 [Streptococcus salivarius]